MKNLISIIALVLVSFSATAQCCQTIKQDCVTITLCTSESNGLYYHNYTVENSCTDGLTDLKIPQPVDAIIVSRESIAGFTTYKTLTEQYVVLPVDAVTIDFEYVTNEADPIETFFILVELEGTQYTLYFDNLDCNSLPVELSRFRGSQQGDEIVLNWTTESELNNRFFDVVELVNNQYSFVERVQGNGTTNEKSNYSISFKPEKRGLKYYKILQVDYDGTETESNTIAIFYDTIESDVLQVLPNLINEGEQAKIIVGGTLSNNLFRVTVTDVKGQKVAGFKGLVMNETESNEIIMTDTNTQGIYFVTLYCKGQKPVVKRFVIK